MDSQQFDRRRNRPDVQGPKWGWTSFPILGCIVGAALLIPLFVVRSFRQSEPLLDVRLFKVRNVWTTSLANVGADLFGGCRVDLGALGRPVRTQTPHLVGMTHSPYTLYPRKAAPSGPAPG